VKVLFGPYILDTSTGELWHRGMIVRLAPQPTKVLVLLVSRSGSLVTREEIQQQVWDLDTFVDFDQSLNACIRQIRAALRDNAEKPAYVETLPRRGYRFLQSVTPLATPAIDPPAIEPIAAIEPVPPPPIPSVAESAFVAPPPVPSRWPALSTTVSTIFLGLLGIVGVYIYYRSVHHAQVLAVEAPPLKSARRSVAVYGFSNKSGHGQIDWLGSALTEMLDSQMGAQDHLRVAPGTDVAQLQRELGANDVNPDNATAIHKALGVDLLVNGSYRLTPDATDQQVELDVQLQNLVTHKVQGEVKEIGDLAHLQTLVERTTADLGPLLLPGEHMEQEANSLAGLSENQTALRYYSEGLKDLRGYETQSARSDFEKAIATDPSFEMAHAHLSDALAELGNHDGAKAEAQKAFELSKDLPRAQRISAEASYRDLAGEEEQAIALYRALFTFYPDEVDVGINLAYLQTNSDDFKGALSTIAAIRSLPLTPSDEVQTDRQEAWAYENMAEHQASEEYTARRHKLVQHSIDVAQRNGSRLLLGTALRGECLLNGFDRPSAPVIAACQQARTIFQSVGNMQAVAAMTNDIAIMDENDGRLDQATAGYEQAENIYRDIGDLADANFMLLNETTLHEHRGDLPATLRTAQEMSKAHDTSKDAQFYFDGAFYQATAYLEQGQLEQADVLARQAVETAKQQRSAALRTEFAANATSLRGQIALERGSINDARKLFSESRSMLKQDDKVFLAASDLRLAQVDTLEGHGTPTTITTLQASIKTLAGTGEDDDMAAQAAVTLANQLLLLNQVNDAKKALASAPDMEHRNVRIDTQLDYHLTEAKVAYASQHLDEAVRILKNEIDSAAAHGFIGRQLEGQIQLARWNQAGGPSELKRLLARADHLGYRGFMVPRPS
jgi:DNA-binding winged helix-turn-helix (wHTH) protein/tetratricopeptide (TPR) repeat protein